MYQQNVCDSSGTSFDLTSKSLALLDISSCIGPARHVLGGDSDFKARYSLLPLQTCSAFAPAEYEAGPVLDARAVGRAAFRLKIVGESFPTCVSLATRIPARHTAWVVCSAPSLRSDRY